MNSFWTTHWNKIYNAEWKKNQTHSTVSFKYFYLIISLPIKYRYHSHPGALRDIARMISHPQMLWFWRGRSFPLNSPRLGSSLTSTVWRAVLTRTSQLRWCDDDEAMMRPMRPRWWMVTMVEGVLFLVIPSLRSRGLYFPHRGPSLPVTVAGDLEHDPRSRFAALAYCFPIKKLWSCPTCAEVASCSGAVLGERGRNTQHKTKVGTGAIKKMKQNTNEAKRKWHNTLLGPSANGAISVWVGQYAAKGRELHHRALDARSYSKAWFCFPAQDTRKASYFSSVGCIFSCFLWILFPSCFRNQNPEALQGHLQVMSCWCNSSANPCGLRNPLCASCLQASSIKGFPMAVGKNSINIGVSKHN